jgi:hypothetical protein
MSDITVRREEKGEVGFLTGRFLADGYFHPRSFLLGHVMIKMASFLINRTWYLRGGH